MIVDKVSNEVEWFVPNGGVKKHVERLNNVLVEESKGRVYLEEENEHCIECVFSKFVDVDALNERLSSVTRFLKEKVQLVGGGTAPFSLCVVAPSDPLERFNSVCDQCWNQMVSFQQVLGIRKGFEQEGMRLWRALLGVSDVLALLAGSSNCGLLFTSKGWKPFKSSTLNARLVAGYGSMINAAVSPLYLLFAVPRVVSLLNYEKELRKRVNTIVKFLDRLKGESVEYFKEGFKKCLFDHYYLSKSFAFPVKVRLEHRDETSAFSLEIRVYDNPSRDVEESVEVMQALNAFVINNLWLILEVGERRFKPGLMGTPVGYFYSTLRPLVVGELSETLNVAHHLLSNARLDAKYSALLWDRVKRFGA